MSESTALQPTTGHAANSQPRPINTPIGSVTTNIALCLREFVGQQSTPQPSTQINSASVKDFKQAIAVLAKPHVFREVLVPATGPMTYAPELPPDASAATMDPFILLRSSRNNKKPFKLSEVSAGLLAKWGTESDESDQSNAARTAVQVDLVQRLKTTHSARYTAPDISYHLWANYIVSKEPHMREQLIGECPPASLIQHFQCADTDDALHNRMTHTSNLVAIRQNESAIQKFERTIERIKGSKRSLEEAEAEAEGGLLALKIRQSVLMDFSMSLQPRETGNSLDLLARVGLQDDIDHDTL
ncbi:hypothetical protein HDU81_009051 [Chytriomyces hyalinus]|nr:hypothetical protein HDU81_009051 [Chytriomyces hyalinus]